MYRHQAQVKQVKLSLHVVEAGGCLKVDEKRPHGSQPNPGS